MKRKSMLIGNYENNSVAFVVIDSLITNIITGTDTGSTIIQSLLRVIVAAAILIGVVMSIGRKGI
jgi:archaellum biogenesis protein FlaJ (TadC family)